MYLSLQKLTISNFRGIRNPITLNFANLPAGLYFVQGRNEAEKRLGANGSGKSSLFIDAIYWVLANKIARSQRPSGDIVNWDSNKKLASVVFEATFDGVIHKVERTRNPNKLVLDSTPAEQREVDDLLPLADAALRRSILIDQFGEMFLSLKPEAKAQLFSETLGLDTWLRASDKASKALSDAEKEIQTLERELAAAESAIEEVSDQMRSARTQETAFEETMKGLIREAHTRRQEAFATAEAANRALDSARAALNAVGGVDDVVVLNTQKSMRRAQQAELSRREGLVLSLEREVIRLTQKLDAYSGNIKTCPECGQKVTDDHIQEQRENLEGSVKETKKSYREAKESVQIALTEFDKLCKEIDTRELALSEHTAKQDVVSARAAASIAANKAVHRITDEIEELRIRDNPHSAQYDKAAKRLKTLRAEEKETKDSLTKLETDVEIYKFWQRGFKEIRLQQIDSTLLELELSANRHAEELGLEGWEIGFATEREKKTGGLSQGFSVFLYPPDQPEPISWESYSGGESQRWQLATTFGIAEILLARSGVGTDFEILDEPTIHLSPEGIDDLLVCLKDRATELNRRIFVIDHHSLGIGNFDGVLTVVKDKKNGVYVEDGGIASIVLVPAEEVKKQRVRLD